MTIVGLLLTAIPFTFGKPLLKTRQSSCTAEASYSISNSGGGPGQAPFTNINSGLLVTKDGNTVYGNSDNTFASQYSITIEPDQWGGADPIYFQSDNDAESASYADCSLTDTTSGQYYTGTVQSGFDEGTVTVQTSSCTVNFLC